MTVNRFLLVIVAVVVGLGGSALIQSKAHSNREFTITTNITSFNTVKGTQLGFLRTESRRADGAAAITQTSTTEGPNKNLTASVTKIELPEDKTAVVLHSLSRFKSTTPVSPAVANSWKERHGPLFGGCKHAVEGLAGQWTRQADVKVLGYVAEKWTNYDEASSTTRLLIPKLDCIEGGKDIVWKGPGGAIKGRTVEAVISITEGLAPAAFQIPSGLAEGRPSELMRESFEKTNAPGTPCPNCPVSPAAKADANYDRARIPAK